MRKREHKIHLIAVCCGFGMRNELFVSCLLKEYSDEIGFENTNTHQNVANNMFFKNKHEISLLFCAVISIFKRKMCL